MKQETFDKLQNLAEDLASSDGVGYDSFEQDFIENSQEFSIDDELSSNQEIKVEEIWDRKMRYKMSKYILPTFTGIEFDLLYPTAEMITIEDIAHHLAQENRFNGSIRFPYSVGYHSVLVCKQAPDEFKLEALLHDSHEAYYKDFTSPLKNMLRIEFDMEYNNVINYYEILAERKFKLNWSAFNKELKTIDYRMCATEITQLLPNFPEASWYSCKGYEIFKDINIMERNWRNVEIEFLDLFNKYKR